MKFVLWALVGIVVVLWLMRGKKGTAVPKAAGTTRAREAGGDAEPMSPCAFCGVHIPVSEAVVTASGTVYCNEEHRLRHAAS